MLITSFHDEIKLLMTEYRLFSVVISLSYSETLSICPDICTWFNIMSSSFFTNLDLVNCCKWPVVCCYFP